MSDRTKAEAFSTAKDGTRIRYVLWGNSSASRRVVLIHALGNVAEFWEATVSSLGPEWEALALDCRGHGASDKPAGPYSVELMADDIASVMDHAGWDSAVVGGASMGGCISMAVAARHPARVAGLALIDTTSWYGADAEAAWEERGQKAAEGGMAALIGFQKTRWFSDNFRESNPDILQRAIDTFTANDVPAYLETCRMLGRADMRPALSGFQCPVAIMVGEEDYATPIAMAEALVAAIPGATLKIVPGARHLTPLEVPDTVARLIHCL